VSGKRNFPEGKCAPSRYHHWGQEQNSVYHLTSLALEKQALHFWWGEVEGNIALMLCTVNHGQTDHFVDGIPECFFPH